MKSSSSFKPLLVTFLVISLAITGLVYANSDEIYMTKVDKLMSERISGSLTSVQGELMFLNDTPISNKTLDFFTYIENDSILIGSNITDYRGVARVFWDISDLNSSTYTVNSSFVGNEDFLGSFELFEVEIENGIQGRPIENETINVIDENETNTTDNVLDNNETIENNITETVEDNRTEEVVNKTVEEVTAEESFENTTEQFGFAPVIRDSSNRKIDAEFEILTSKNKEKINKKNEKWELNKGKYDIKVKIKNNPIKSIDFYNFKLKENISDFIRVDDAPEEDGFAEIYSIDPTNIEFEEADVTVTAKANSLYKCKEWDFENQKCNGEWKLLTKDLTPGEDYTFRLTPEDPGFAEINATDAIHLDENYSFLSNIYSEVKLRDDIWSEPIHSNEFVRVEYERDLGNGNVIDVFVRSSGDVYFEIYNVNSDSPLLGSSGSIRTEGEWKFIRLENVDNPTNVFDFKVIGDGYLEFDYIHDQYTEEFFDDFETDNFAATWTQSAGNDWARLTQRSYGGGSYSAEVDGAASDDWLKRDANYDVSSYDYCNLSAQIYIEDRFDSNEFICMDFSTDGGSTWNRDTGSPGQVGVADLCVDGDVDTENAWNYVSYNVSGSNLTSTFTFRFRASVSNSNEDGNIDHVNLTCYEAPPEIPRWWDQGQNTSSAMIGSPVLLYTRWTDNTGLDTAILSTNETGAWDNKTTYGSPDSLTGTDDWSNFTWENDTISTSTVVAWKINANDTGVN